MNYSHSSKKQTAKYNPTKKQTNLFIFSNLPKQVRKDAPDAASSCNRCPACEAKCHSVESKATISLCVDQLQPWQQHKHRTHGTAQRQCCTRSHVSDRHSYAQYPFTLWTPLVLIRLSITETLKLQ